MTNDDNIYPQVFWITENRDPADHEYTRKDKHIKPLFIDEQRKIIDSVDDGNMNISTLT